MSFLLQSNLVGYHHIFVSQSHAQFQLRQSVQFPEVRIEVITWSAQEFQV